ncbi:MAG: YecA family protein [Pseudomonadota bacterium]|nr:YecA family protein [Pseudomonadota bacterium]
MTTKPNTHPPPARSPQSRSRRPPTLARGTARPARLLPGLTEREIDELQVLLDSVPAPLDPLDVVMLDGYLCGVLVQPTPVPAARWLRHVTDVDGRALPVDFDRVRLHALVERRHAQLDHAIAHRLWFDPWVFALEDDAGDDEGRDAAAVAGAGTAASIDEDDGAVERGAPADAVYPWVAGFATALTLLPTLAAAAADALTEPLALLYQHLAADDLEDADELLAEIDTLEPPADLAAAVEGLVRATLLLADVGRPLELGRPRG